MSELSLALRRFRRRPGRALVGVATLSLGIAASTASFSAVRAVLLEPLPVADQDELVVLWGRNEARDFAHVPFLPAAFDAVAASQGAFSGVAAFLTVGALPALADGLEGSFAIQHARVGGDFFGVLGARPAVGRLLTAADDRVGADPVAVVSHDYWVRRAGADPALVGTTLRYGRNSFTIVGVAGPGFDIPQGTEAWATVRGSYPDWAEEAPPNLEMDLIARLAPGVTLGAALTSTDAVIARSPDLPEITRGMRTVGVRLTEFVIGSLDPVLRATLGAAILLLVVATANSTLLFLTGGARSAREIALRRALGARRLGVVVPLLMDAGLVAGMGVGVGIALAWVALKALLPLAPADFARFDEISLNWWAVAFAASLGASAMLASSVMAGAWLARGEPRDVLAAGGRTFSGGGERIRRTIASAQVALAVVAAVGAGLVGRTVSNLVSLDRGFDPEGLYIANLTLPFPFEVSEGYVAGLEELSAGIASRPGVLGATVTISAPLSERAGIDFVPRLEGQAPAQAEANPYVGLDMVLPGYFEVAGTDVVEGRTIGDEDRAGSPLTVVVNEAAARALWPGQRAVGQRMYLGPIGAEEEPRTVVGVVENHRYRTFPEARPAVYVPLRQFWSFPPTRLLVRADGSVGSIRDLVSEELSGAMPGVRVLTIESMADVMRGPMLRPRFAAAVLLVFALVTLALACLGVYGVFSVLVHERTRELGIRRALGAQAQHLIGFVTMRVLVVGLAGGVGGIVVSLWAGRLLESVLYGVEVGDPGVLGAAVVGSLLLGCVAGAAPAMQAVRTDPVESLRSN